MLLENSKIYWAKVLGKPRPTKYNEEGEWSFDLSLSPEAKVKVKENGAGSRIKNSDDERGDYVTFRKRGFLKDGSPAKAIPIVDHRNEDWDKNTLIGNGSTVNVSVLFDTYGEGKKKNVSIKPMAIQVWDHVKFKRSDFKVKEDGEPAETPVAESW